MYVTLQTDRNLYVADLPYIMLGTMLKLGSLQFSWRWVCRMFLKVEYFKVEYLAAKTLKMSGPRYNSLQTKILSMGQQAKPSPKIHQITLAVFEWFCPKKYDEAFLAPFMSQIWLKWHWNNLHLHIHTIKSQVPTCFGYKQSKQLDFLIQSNFSTYESCLKQWNVILMASK